MKFTVGYQPRPTRDFLDAILAHREAIAEVYFPWGDLPNGRGTLTGFPGEQPFEVRNKLVEALAEFSAAGIGLNLLLNGNCYGRSFRRSATRPTGSAIVSDSPR